MLESIVALLEGSRAFLLSLLPISFTISLLFTSIFFLLNFHRMREYFKIRRYTWVILTLIFLLAISLRALTPVYLTTYTDEFSHIEVGKWIAFYGKAGMCEEFPDSREVSCWLFNEPVGFSYIISLFFLVLGVSEASAYAVNLVMGSLLAVIVFLLCFLLFKNERAGLYSAFILSILPLYILLSRNIEPDTVSAFFIILTFLGFLLFSKIRDFKTGMFAMGILAFSVSIKQENVLLIPLVLLLMFLFVDLKEVRCALKNKKSWFLFVLFVILATPHILHLSLELYPAFFYGKSTATAVGGQLIKVENIGMNAEILNRAMDGSFYPLLINLFVVIGVLHVLRKKRREGVFLVIFFLSYMFVYLSYSATIVEKYLITGLLPLICFAGVGMYATEEFVTTRFRNLIRWKTINFAVPLILVVGLLLLSLPYFYEIRENPKPLNVNHGYPRTEIHYKEMETIRMMDREIDSCYVITEEPIFFSATDLKPIKTESVLMNPETLKEEGGKCIFYFEDLYCTNFYSLGDRCGIENESFERCEEFRQKIVSRCREMHEEYQLKPYLKYEWGNFTFTVYNISLGP